MVVLLALVAALVSGTADYLGGRAAAQHPALTVNFWAHLLQAALLPAFVLLIGWERLRASDVALGLAAGLAVGAAYLLFFHALAAGRMSVIAPLAALTTALVPVSVDVFTGVSLPGLRWTGVALALAAIPALAFRRDDGLGSLTLRQEVTYAVAAGFGFAGFFMAIGHTNTESGQWPVVFAALSATATMGSLCLVRGQPMSRPPRLAVAAGLLMTGSALAITHALQLGPIAVATVLGSLYPLATTALAHRFDGEPVGRVNLAGIVAAIAGAALIAGYR